MLLREIQPDATSLFREIDEFREFLKSNPRAERDQFLPFFATHLQLCAHIGTLNDIVSTVTHVGTEISLWGDFSCDLVAGSQANGAFVFVEFEDASEKSLFRQQPGRKNSHWGTRVEQGISQVVDWLFRISSESTSDQLVRDFGARHLALMGLVVTGRSNEVSDYDRVRLDWRSKHTNVGGARLAILTYDDLLEWLDGRVALFRTSSEDVG
jgi:hypothetical protein